MSRKHAIKHRLVAAMVFLTSACSIASDQQDSVLCYAPCVVEMAGLLVEEERFGPPNFGETPKSDEQLKILVLVLDRRQTIRSKSGDDAGADELRGINRIQLVGFASAAPIRSLVSRRVIARGELQRAVAPMHFFPVVLKVTSVRLETSH